MHTKEKGATSYQLSISWATLNADIRKARKMMNIGLSATSTF